MPTKVAIFRNADPAQFRNDINDFIKDKNIIDIKHNVTTSPAGRIYDSALVIYHVPKEDNK